jgi:hypothetical protein
MPLFLKMTLEKIGHGLLQNINGAYQDIKNAHIEHGYTVEDMLDRE